MRLSREESKQVWWVMLGVLAGVGCLLCWGLALLEWKLTGRL